MEILKEIDITEIENIQIGHAQNFKAATGCTVILCKKGAVTGLDVRGGGPASRESELLNPRATTDIIHAVLLSGGSAYGLDAAGGVMRYLEERNIGYKIGGGVVPLVCESCIFDLALGNFHVRPDQKMGYEACQDAEHSNCKSGILGAGTGATVGKICGPDRMMKSGLGCYAVQLEGLKVGAVVAVNAFGDVFDDKTGKKLAGLLNKEKSAFEDSEMEIYRQYELDAGFVGNTTIGAIITNAKFSKAQMGKIAAMAQNGIARTVRPVHTSVDGDSVYAMSVGEESGDVDVVGTLASQVMAEAIKQAVLSTPNAYGHPGAKDFLK